MKRFAAGLVLAALAAAPAFAQKTVTFAHQDMIVPLRTVMESGELEKATGYKINWRMFGGGGDVIKAMASGDVHLATLSNAAHEIWHCFKVPVRVSRLGVPQVG